MDRSTRAIVRCDIRPKRWRLVGGEAGGLHLEAIPYEEGSAAAVVEQVRGIITDIGSVASHLASVAREFRVPVSSTRATTPKPSRTESRSPATVRTPPSMKGSSTE